MQMRNPFQAQEVALNQTVIKIFHHKYNPMAFGECSADHTIPSETALVILLGMSVFLICLSILIYWRHIDTRYIVLKMTIEIFKTNTEILKLSQESLVFSRESLKFSQESFVMAVQCMNTMLESFEKHVATTEKAMREFKTVGIALEARLAGVESKTEYLDGSVQKKVE